MYISDLWDRHGEGLCKKKSRTNLTETEKYESRDTEDISMMPVDIPMIAVPGAITTRSS
jgi:small neutral amino acid transporter SnatA (MarC family)